MSLSGFIRQTNKRKYIAAQIKESSCMQKGFVTDKENIFGLLIQYFDKRLTTGTVPQE